MEDDNNVIKCLSPDLPCTETSNVQLSHLSLEVTSQR